MCLNGGEGVLIHVFDNADAREAFIDTDLWVEFVRVFRCVEDGDVFTGVAGANWMVSNFGAPTKSITHTHELREALNAGEVQSVPADGTSGQCEGIS